MIVRESINFERGQDPLKTMGIGKTMREKMLLKELERDPNISSFQNPEFISELDRDNIYYAIDGSKFEIAYDSADSYTKGLLNEILDRIAEIDPSYRNNFALSHAAAFGKPEICKLLLKDSRVKQNINSMAFATKERLMKMNLLDKNGNVINETLSFNRGENPLHTMGIGGIIKVKDFMTELKDYMVVSKWQWKVNDDLSIDIFWDEGQKEPPLYVSQCFDISIDKYALLPKYIKFRNIYGNMACNFVTKESLRSFPDRIYGDCTFFGRFSKEFNPGDIKCKIRGSIIYYDPEKRNKEIIYKNLIRIYKIK